MSSGSKWSLPSWIFLVTIWSSAKVVFTKDKIFHWKEQYVFNGCSFTWYV
jgi:hypothetical protein